MRKANRLLLCDMDDTILDMSGADAASFRFALGMHGITCPPDHTLWKWRRRGMTAEEILGRLTTRTSACLATRRAFLDGGGGSGLLRPMTGASHMLRCLHETHNTVIVTARRSRHHAWNALVRTGLSGNADMVLCGEDWSGDSRLDIIKQHLYVEAMRRYDMPAERCVVVGNLVTDIVAGMRIGIKSYGVIGTYGADSRIVDMAPMYESLVDLTAEIIGIDP